MQSDANWSTNQTKTVWEETTDAATLAHNKKRITCKSGVKTHNSPCMGRHGSHLGTAGAHGFATPEEEARMNNVKLAREVVEITVDVERSFGGR